jgi:hypothetical protein
MKENISLRDKDTKRMIYVSDILVGKCFLKIFAGDLAVPFYEN